MGPFKARICFDWLRTGPQHCQGLGPLGELGHGRTCASALPAPASVAILQWRGVGWGGEQGELGAEPHVELSHSCRQFIELLVSFSRTQPSRKKSGKCWPRWVVKAPAPRANVDTGSWVMGAGWVEAYVRSPVCSWNSGPDAVADRHVVFRLHQPEAVPAEIKFRDLHVGVDQLQVKVHQHEEHESAERWC